jgi:magnesium transporter
MRLHQPIVDVRRLRRALGDEDVPRAAELASALAPADLAEALLKMTPAELASLEPFLGAERLADAVAQLDPTEAARLLVRFSRADAADILEEMEPDDATDVVEELDEDEANRILSEMDLAEAREIRDLMAYPPDTAGGRMTPEFVAIGPDITVAAAMRQIRANAPSAEQIYAVYVTDRNHHLVGVICLRDLVLADPWQRISSVMRHQVIRVPADADQERAAGLLMDHDLIALPVVDEDTRLIGVLTADDLADVVEEEATEDIERLGGSEPLGEPYLSTPPWVLFRKRIVWLMVLFLAGTYTSAVLQIFSGTLAQVVALSFFIPLLIGTGGNVGSQIVTTLVRAMAVGDVELRDVWRVLGRELLIGLSLGVVMAAAMFIRAETMGVDLHIGLVVSLAAIFIVLWSASVAAILPMVLHRVGIDPAVVSAPLITTLVDGTGLFIYLTVARAVLGI